MPYCFSVKIIICFLQHEICFSQSNVDHETTLRRYETLKPDEIGVRILNYFKTAVKLHVDQIVL